MLASYTFKHGLSLPVRWEYISSSESATDDAVNLLYIGNNVVEMKP
jgi:hypothetical protein